MALNKPQPHRTQPNEISDPVDLFVALGRSLYGEQWQPQLAKILGMSKSHVHGIATNAKPLTPKTKARLVAALLHLRDQILEDARYRHRIVAETILRFGDDL